METVTFSTAAKIAAAVFALLQVGLLVLNNVQIGAQLKIVEQQRDFQAKNDPLVRDLRPVAEEAARRIPETRRAARDAAALVRAARPLVSDLQRVDVDDVLTSVGSLAQGLSARNRLVGLVDRSDRLLSRIDDSDVIGSTARAADRAPRFMDELLRVQKETLATQRESLRILKQSMAIQQETLAHARSLDRKTGGTAPSTGRLRQAQRRWRSYARNVKARE